MRSIEVAVLMIFHPIDACYVIKKERANQSLLPIAVILVLVMVIRVLQIYLTHFPLSGLDPTEANLGSEMFIMITPLLSWAISAFGVTSIIDGKMTIRESLTAAAYSMMPYILLTIPLALLSRVMSGNEYTFYRMFETGIWVWVAVLFFLHISRLNEFGFWKTLGTVVLTVFGILLIWVSVGIIFTLTNQLYQFLRDVYLELTIRLIQ